MPRPSSCSEGCSHEVPSRGLPSTLRAKTLPHPHSEPWRIAVFAVQRTTRDRLEAWTTHGPTSHPGVSAAPPPTNWRTWQRPIVVLSRSRHAGGLARAHERGMKCGAGCSMESTTPLRQIRVPTIACRPEQCPRRAIQIRRTRSAGGKAHLGVPPNGSELARIIPSTWRLNDECDRLLACFGRCAGARRHLARLAGASVPRARQGPGVARRSLHPRRGERCGA